MSPSLTRKTFEMKKIRSDIHKHKEAGTLEHATLAEAATGTTATEGAEEAVHEVQMALRGVGEQHNPNVEVDPKVEPESESDDAGTKRASEDEATGGPPAAAAEVVKGPFPDIVPSVPELGQPEATEDATPEQQEAGSNQKKSASHNIQERCPVPPPIPLPRCPPRR